MIVKYKKIFIPFLLGMVSFSEIFKPQKVLSDYVSAFTGDFFLYSESDPTPTGFGRNTFNYGTSNWYWNVDFNLGDVIEIGTISAPNVDTYIFIYPEGANGRQFVADNDDTPYGNEDHLTALGQDPGGTASCLGMTVLCSYISYEFTSAGTYQIVIGDLMDSLTESDLTFSFASNFIFSDGTDDGDATYLISGTANIGSVLTASLSSSDPDGDGTFSYQWQSSTDQQTWTSISGATNSTYTITDSEDGKYIKLLITYTDGDGFSETLTVLFEDFISSSESSSFHTEWVQPYAAMQNLGLKSIHNNRDLVLAKAGKCNDYGWVIGDSDYCAYTNANNSISNIEGDSTKGSYETAAFNSSLNLEKTINAKWKAGIAYGVGSSNLNGYNFSNTTASLSSTNTHYSIYGVKKVNDKFTLKGIIGGSDFDYKGERNYLTTSATSSYDSDGYTAEINGSWDIKKTIKNTKNPIRLQPSFGVAYAAHTQDGFSESGSGDLITIDPNQAESLLFKTGIAIDKQILMEGGKWLLVPSIALNYEVDAYAYSDHRGLKGSLTESSTASTRVSAKNMGEQTGSVKVGADFVVTKDLMFNLNAKYGLADGGDEQSYGGGFKWAF